MHDVTKLLGERGYKFEFEYGRYGWEWDITRVYSRDGHVFSLSASGCSCNEFDDRFADADDAIGSMIENSRAPDMLELVASYDSYTDTAETIQARYRELGLR